MKIDYIKINIRDNRKYGDVALLVDKPGFADWIKELRIKWEIKTLFKPNEYIKFYSHILGTNEDTKRWEIFMEDIKKVRTNFSRTPNFDTVIIYALAFTEIPEQAYRSCYIKTIHNPQDFNDVEYGIIVTPYSTENEVKKTLSDFKRDMKNSIRNSKDKNKIAELVANYATTYEFDTRYNPIPKEIANLIRDRKWYWLHKRFKSYSKVLKVALDNGEAISRDGIVKAITSYRQRLV